jgi:hypothetical protein
MSYTLIALLVNITGLPEKNWGMDKVGEDTYCWWVGPQD